MKHSIRLKEKIWGLQQTEKLVLSRIQCGTIFQGPSGPFENGIVPKCSSRVAIATFQGTRGFLWLFDDLKYEDNLKYEDDLKYEDKLKYEDDLKYEVCLKQEVGLEYKDNLKYGDDFKNKEDLKYEDNL